MLTEEQVEAEAAPRFTHKQVLEIMIGLMLAMLTSMISTSVVGTALPTIVGTLGGQEQLAWVASATLLTMTASTPLWGKLSDLYGRKRMFQVSLLIFVLASVAAGFAQDMGQLIAARAVQGIGAGGLRRFAQIILGDIVEPRERGRYSGYIGAVFGVSTVAGPLLGGFIVDTMVAGAGASRIGVPLAVVASVVIQKVLKLPTVRRDATVDWWGATIITGRRQRADAAADPGGQEFAWNSAWTYGLGALSLRHARAGVFAERTGGRADPAAPAVPNRTFVLTALASLFVGVAMFGAMMYLPQYLQIVKGLSPTGSGLMTLPMVCGLLLSSIVSGRIVTRTGRWKAFPVAGMLLVAAGLFLLSRAARRLLADGHRRGHRRAGHRAGPCMQILILAAQNAVRPCGHGLHHLGRRRSSARSAARSAWPRSARSCPTGSARR